MIKRLTIQNLAIIDELEVTFGPQLNVISGETGAGKSILMAAIGLLLGGRAGHDLVRSGAPMAVVEGEFFENGQSWIVRRLIKPGGASRAFIDEEPIKIALLGEQAEGWMDLHGQHDHQTLLRVGTHIDYLDAYTGLNGARRSVGETYRALMESLKRRDELTAQADQMRQQRELEEFQLKDLTDANLERGEDETLSAELRLLSQAGDLNQVLTTIARRVQADENALSAELGSLARQMDKFADLSVDLESLQTRLNASKVELDDIGFETQRYQSTVTLDPARLAEVEERLAALETIKRKYGGTIETAIDRREALSQSVTNSASAESELATISGEIDRLKSTYSDQCQQLSKGRLGTNSKLADEIIASLSALDMPGVNFEVRVNQSPNEDGLCTIDGTSYKSDASGCDNVEFFMSANAGEIVRPMAKIASGGEISRTMLGIKSVLAAYDPVGTLVFDEIDSGVSGATAQKVGVAIEGLAKDRQILCITHLPQIASRGDNHYCVQKSTVEGRTMSTVVRLAQSERKQEIARLLSGVNITDASLVQADELLSNRPIPNASA